MQYNQNPVTYPYPILVPMYTRHYNFTLPIHNMVHNHPPNSIRQVPSLLLPSDQLVLPTTGETQQVYINPCKNIDGLSMDRILKPVNKENNDKQVPIFYYGQREANDSKVDLKNRLNGSLEQNENQHLPMLNSNRPCQQQRFHKTSGPTLMASKNGNLIISKQQHKEYVFVCGQCSVRFSSKYNLNIHIKQKHSAYWTKIQNLEAPFACEYCAARFATRQSVKNHAKRNHPEVARDLHQVLPKYIQKQIEISCSYCDKTFRVRSIRRHLRDCLKKPFKCIHCETSFTTKYSCKVHILKNHSVEDTDLFQIKLPSQSSDLIATVSLLSSSKPI